MASSKSLLNKVNVGNCYTLAKSHLDEKYVTSYAKCVEEIMDNQADLHPCNIIGMVGLLHFWRKLGARPTIPKVQLAAGIFSRPVLLRNHVTFSCILYMFDLLEEKDLINMTDFLFEHFYEPMSLVCLSRVFDIVYTKLKTHSPSSIESFYAHFLKLSKEKPATLRHKFLLQDLEDMFSNKYKRVYPYIQDMQFILGTTIEVSEGIKSSTQGGSSKFQAFFSTQLRKIIFDIVRNSEDPLDCFRRINELSLSKKQMSELFLVLMFCACKEKPYNEFYLEVIRSITIKTPRSTKLIRGTVFKLFDMKTFVNVQFCKSYHRLATSLNIRELESVPRNIMEGLDKQCVKELKELIKE